MIELTKFQNRILRTLKSHPGATDWMVASLMNRRWPKKKRYCMNNVKYGLEVLVELGLVCPRLTPRGRNWNWRLSEAGEKRADRLLEEDARQEQQKLFSEAA